MHYVPCIYVCIDWSLLTIEPDYLIMLARSCTICYDAIVGQNHVYSYAFDDLPKLPDVLAMVVIFLDVILDVLRWVVMAAIFCAVDI